MKKLYYNMIIAVLCLLATACSDDDDFKYDSPEYLDEIVTYEKALEQGTGIYTDDVKYFYDKYKAVLMYEFPVGMFYYNGFMPSLKDRYYTFAKEEYVGDVLKLFKKLLSVFPDSLTQILMPRQILIADTVGVIFHKGEATEKRTVKMAESDGLCKIILGGAGDGVHDYFINDKKLTTSFVDKLGACGVFRQNLFVNWILSLFTNGKLPYPDFYYTDEVLSPTNRDHITFMNHVEYAMLGGSAYSQKEQAKFIEMDFKDFISELFKYGANGFAKYYFVSKKDKQGLIKKKYDIIMNEFSEKYGIDLEKLISDDILNIKD